MGDEYIGDFAIDLGDWCQEHAGQIGADLGRYFTGFNGRHFERFSAMGSADANRFAATDILAVEALSVTVPPNSAAKLIDTEADDRNSLLRQIPTDKDLWEVKPSDLEARQPGMAVALPAGGPTRCRACDGNQADGLQAAPADAGHRHPRLRIATAASCDLNRCCGGGGQFEYLVAAHECVERGRKAIRFQSNRTSQ